MHIVSNILGALGVVAVGAAALIYFAPKDNSDAAALAMIPVMLFGAIGALLLVLALIARVI